MPALISTSATDYNLADALVARDDLFDPSAGSVINAKNIVILIFVAIFPVLIVAGVVSWLLCCYSLDRTGCCGRRKKENKAKSPAPPPKEITRNIRLSESQNTGRTPITRPVLVAHLRSDSTMSRESNISGQLENEKGPTLPKGFV